ncbi:hypothetical protein HDV05_000980, partial [Chytridiales sp. JEL 0842]
GVDFAIKSLILLIRDRNSTSKIIDTLVPTLYDHAEGHDDELKAGILKFKGPDGKIKLVNQDVEWSLLGWRDRVLMREGPKDVVWNNIKVPHEDWREQVYKSSETLSRQSSGWFGGLINNLVASPSDSTSTTSQDTLPAAESAPIITPEDHDPAASDDILLTKVDFEFLRLYLLVGYITPHQTPTDAPLSSLNATVHSLTLIATSEYIYLAAERFDVWPPPLFPPEFNPAESVNKPLLDLISSPATPPSATPQNIDPFKGLTSDRVPQWSPPLRVGRVKDLVRCERWRTWRWALGPVTQMGEASEIERVLAMKIQNGAVGHVSAGPQPLQQGVRRKDKFEGGVGNTGGWGWWVRVVFKAPDGKGKQREEEEGGGSGGEYWWDLVFGTIDAANEFLEYVRDVRGVKESDDAVLPVQDLEDIVEPEDVFPVDGDEDVIDASRDEKLLTRVRTDGVQI